MRLWLGAFGLALCSACQSGAESAQVEPPPSRLATRIDRMLDDPSQLPSVAPAPAEAPDAASTAADAESPAQDGVGASDLAQGADSTGADSSGAESTAAAAPGAAAASAGQAADAAIAPAKAANPPAIADAGQAAPAPVAKLDPKPTDAAAQAKTTKPDAKPDARIVAKPEPKPETKPKPPAEPEPEASPAAKPEGDATDLYYSGKRKLDAGDLRGAIEDLKASQAIRYSVRTLTLLGRAYFDLGEFGPAATALKKAGTYDEAMLLLAQLYQQQGKNAQARKVYEQFLKVHADHPKAAWVKRIVEAL